MRRLAASATSVIGLGLVVLLAVSLYFAAQIESGALKVVRPSELRDLEVVSVQDGLIELRRIDGSAGPGLFGLVGLAGPNGYARVGLASNHNGDRVTREFFPFSGSISPGEHARLDHFAYPRDPNAAYGMPFDEVSIPSAHGPLPSWRTAGRGDAWVILLHGQGAGREEELRALKVVGDIGLPSITISYRNDGSAADDPSGYYQYGLTEWADLDAAAQYAINNGAQRLVLVGHSLGGAVVASFLSRSPLADRVVGVVLDAPMLDFSQVIDLAARQRQVPDLVTVTAKQIAAFRYGVDWPALDYVDRLAISSAPMLVFHGERDTVVPMAISQRLAAASPDRIRLVTTPGAEHATSWNANPVQYEQELSDFLRRVSQ